MFKIFADVDERLKKISYVMVPLDFVIIWKNQISERLKPNFF